MGWRNRGFPCSESRGPTRTRVVAYPPSDTGFWRMRPSSASCVAFLHVRRHSPKHAAAACGGRPVTTWSLRFTFLVRSGLSVFVLLKNFAYHVLSVVWAPFLSPVSVVSACPFFRGVAPCLAWAPRAEELSGLRVVQAFPERPDRGTWGFFHFVHQVRGRCRPIIPAESRGSGPEETSATAAGRSVPARMAAGGFPGSVVPCSAFCAVTPAGRRGCPSPSMFREEWLIRVGLACSGSCREETASFQVCARFRARSAPALCFYLAPASARAYFRAGIQ